MTTRQPSHTKATIVSGVRIGQGRDRKSLARNGECCALARSSAVTPHRSQGRQTRCWTKRNAWDKITFTDPVKKLDDMLVKSTGQRLESLREGRLAPMAYDRPWKLPRSAVSLALWGTILDMGDHGFRQRFAEAVASL